MRSLPRTAGPPGYAPQQAPMMGAQPAAMQGYAPAQGAMGMQPQGMQPGMGMQPQGMQPGMGMQPQPGMGMQPQPGMGMQPQGMQPGMGMQPQGMQPGMGMQPQQPGMAPFGGGVPMITPQPAPAPPASPVGFGGAMPGFGAPQPQAPAASPFAQAASSFFGGGGAPGMQQGMMQPGMGQPGMMQPGMQQGMMQPGMGQPGMMQPGMQQGMMQPGMQQGMMQPGMQQGMMQPGMGQPGMGQPGIGGFQTTPGVAKQGWGTGTAVAVAGGVAAVAGLAYVATETDFGKNAIGSITGALTGSGNDHHRQEHAPPHHDSRSDYRPSDSDYRPNDYGATLVPDELRSGSSSNYDSRNYDDERARSQNSSGGGSNTLSDIGETLSKLL
jgi:hypothetical protein